jgi:alpha-galactosidase
MNKTGLIICAAAVVVFYPFLNGCSGSEPSAVGRDIRVEFNESLESRIIAALGGREIPLGGFRTAEYLVTEEGNLDKFALAEFGSEPVEDAFGRGTKYVLVGTCEDIRKELTVTTYDDFPAIALTRATYRNDRDRGVRVEKWVSNHVEISASIPTDGTPTLVSFQSASHKDRRDWILPLKPGYEEENYLGMNASDYGGGTPVVDVWGRDIGLAVGHVETVPKLVSLPVSMPVSDHAELAVSFDVDRVLEPGETLNTFTTFVSVHQGDCFATLAEYRRLMLRQGIGFRDYPGSAYEPIWCAWGYRRDFTMEQVYGTLPKAKELGFQWAVLDDGWQTAEGDWYLDPKKFPRGDRDMKRLTDTIRNGGMRPKLWWVPMAADPGTELVENHPEFLLINRDGKPQDISWWNAYYLCPAYEPVQEYTRELVKKIFVDWGYEGLKIDGQHLNAAPPCYNESHGHARPEEAVEAVPEFFRIIYETALELTPDAVVEICPCGTSYSFFSMPYMNQPVSSDPLSSWQVRLKGKVFKALMGRDAPYYGDHVELSDNKDDFASTIGIGGVPGSKFTWPIGAKEDSRNDLTPEREKIWAKWLKIYDEMDLPRGEYLGELYDIGFDKPETHAIRKGDSLFYAFYADSFDGTVDLRGLEGRSYAVRDYVNDSDLGLVSGPDAVLAVKFTRSLLIEAVPE